jgi:hypothetical protein
LIATITHFIADNTRRGEGQRLALVLLVALVHGLVYIFLVPPWQHYDEPGHFEYAWLVAAKRTIPEFGQYDHEMRHQVASSMVAHGFFVYGIHTQPRVG